MGRGETPLPQDLTSSPHNDLWAPHISPIQGQTSLRRCMGSKPQVWRKDYWLGWGRDKVMFDRRTGRGVDQHLHQHLDHR